MVKMPKLEKPFKDREDAKAEIRTCGCLVTLVSLFASYSLR